VDTIKQTDLVLIEVNLMGLPIDIAGLDQIIPEIPEGNMIFLEGSIEPIKTIFALNLGQIAIKTGHNITYITSHEQKEVLMNSNYYVGEELHFNIIEDRNYTKWKSYIKKGTVLIIDSFSYLMLDKSLSEFKMILEEMRKLCKEEKAILILTLDLGMLESKYEITGAHLVDGIVQFLFREEPDGIARFMRIPKWMNGHAYDKNIFFTFDDKRINIDSRARVV
jgi:archaellum biogenesis ATPase FlaH